MYKPYLVVGPYGAVRDIHDRILFFPTEKAAKELAEVLTIGSLHGDVYTVVLRRRAGGK